MVRLVEELEPVALLELLDSMLPIVFGEGACQWFPVEEHARQ